MGRIRVYRKIITGGVSLVLAGIVLAVVAGCGDIDMWNTVLDLSTEDPVWKYMQKIMAPDGEAGDKYGTSVNISDDHAIIGAELDDLCGSAYIYKKGSKIWEFEDKVDAGAGDMQSGDAFGHSVSTSGNYAIVGAYLDDEYDSNAGAAYIFKKNVTTWTLLKKLSAVFSQTFIGKV